MPSAEAAAVTLEPPLVMALVPPLELALVLASAVQRKTSGL